MCTKPDFDPQPYRLWIHQFNQLLCQLKTDINRSIWIMMNIIFINVSKNPCFFKEYLKQLESTDLSPFTVNPRGGVEHGPSYDPSTIDIF